MKTIKIFYLKNFLIFDLLDKEFRVGCGISCDFFEIKAELNKLIAFSNSLFTLRFGPASFTRFVLNSNGLISSLKINFKVYIFIEILPFVAYFAFLVVQPMQLYSLQICLSQKQTMI